MTDGVRVYVAVLLLYGCVSQPPTAPAIAAPMEEGKVAYLKGEYVKATAIFRYAVQNDGGADAHYWLARALLAKGDYAGAQEEFDRAVELFDEPFMQAQAMLGAANAAYFDGDYENAAKRYSQLVASHSKHIVITEVLIRWGRASQRANLWDEAEDVFKRLRLQAPTLNELNLAEEGLKFCSENMRHFVVQVGAFENRSSAEELRKRMVESGYKDARIGELSRDGKTIFCVWLGRFKTYREASVVLSKIRGVEKIEDAIIKP